MSERNISPRALKHPRFQGFLPSHTDFSPPALSEGKSALGYFTRAFMTSLFSFCRSMDTNAEMCHRRNGPDETWRKMGS